MVAEPRTRWSPDEQLVPAVLAGTGKKMSQLSSSDRCWVVAGLTVSGLTAEDIADRLDCSLRLVRSIRAEDMTQVCVHMHTETRNFANEVRLSKAAARSARVQLEAVECELSRTREKLDRLIDAQITGTRLCGRCATPMSGYNLYSMGKSGKQFCRECARRRAQEYRCRRKIVTAVDVTVLPFDVAGVCFSAS